MKLLSIFSAAFTAYSDLKIKAVLRELSPDKVIYNKGFAANRLDHLPRVVALVSAAFTLLLASVFLIPDPKEHESNALENLANGLILGGAVSNTSERIARGKVTDYIPLGKYVYNLADFAIYLGSFIKIVKTALTARK